MPPRGSGAGADVKVAWEKAAISATIAVLEANKLLVCLPKLSGGGRAAGGARDAELSAAVVAAILTAVNDVRFDQGREPIGEETLFKNVLPAAAARGGVRAGEPGGIPRSGGAPRPGRGHHARDSRQLEPRHH